MKKGTLAATLLAGLLLGSAWPASAVPEAYDTIDGIPYYFAYGDIPGSHFALGSARDGVGLPFQGCAFAMIRPDLQHGVIRVQGAVGNGTPLEFIILPLPGDGRDAAVAENVPVDANLDDSAPKPAPHADIATWGRATMIVDGDTYADPASGENFTKAEFFATDQGFRDDSTGAATTGHAGDWELHLRMSSLSGGTATSDAATFVPQGDLPDGSLLPSKTHGAIFQFTDTRFSGTGKVHVAASANAPSGMNEITFTVHAPSGVALGNATLRPSLNTPDAADLEFRLGEFGLYTIEARGSVALAKYTVNVVQEPPATFDLNLWWDHVALGNEAKHHYGTCAAQFQSSQGTLAGAIVARPPPPGYNLAAVLAGVGVATVAVILVIALVGHNISTARFRQRSRE